MEKILEKWNLKMNPTKTETLKIGSDDEWKNAMKLGMLPNTKQDCKKRKQLTTTAILKLKKIWNSSITRNKKLRIYKAYVQSIMLFGYSTWAMDKGMVRSVDSFNQKMVRYVCGVFWPNRMKTETLNALIEPASQIGTRRRWQRLGHILRMDDLVPAKQSTINCLKKKNANRERPSTSLLTTIKHDLKAHKLNIDQAVELAQDRDLWKLEGSRTPANEDF